MTTASLDHEHLRSIIAGLYTEAEVEEILNQTQTLVDDFLQRTDLPQAGKSLSAASAALITYGNSVTRDGETPLQSLKSFVNAYKLPTILPLVHILPFYPWDTDRGFSVINYREVDETLGTWEDVRSLGDDVDLMFDFVANHASIDNPLLQAALIARHLSPDDPRYAEYAPYDKYVVAYDENNRPSDDELAQLSRPRPNPVLAPYVVEDQGETVRAFLGQASEAAGTVLGTGFVWATFSRAQRPDGTEDTRQVDLNFANPAVLIETLKILLFYAEQSADVVRLDAIGYIWKKLGSASLHEPEAHKLLAFIDAVIKIAVPHMVTIAEVNEPQDKVFTYLGSEALRESDLVYQFTHFPLAIHAIHKGTGQHYRDWLPTTNQFNGRQFTTITGSHDGLGLKPVRGILPEEELNWLSHKLVDEHGALPNYAKLPGGDEIIYEICATPWHLINNPNDTDDSDTQLARYLAVVSLGLVVRGIPAFYINGVLGSPNYQPAEGLDENRTINREVLDLPALESVLSDTGHQQHHVLEGIRALLTQRGKHAAFAPDGQPLEVLDAGSDAVVAVKLVSADSSDTVYALTNVSAEAVDSTVSLPIGAWQDILATESMEGSSSTSIQLNPYQTRWLTQDS